MLPLCMMLTCNSRPPPHTIAGATATPPVKKKKGKITKPRTHKGSLIERFYQGVKVQYGGECGSVPFNGVSRAHTRSYARRTSTQRKRVCIEAPPATPTTGASRETTPKPHIIPCFKNPQSKLIQKENPKSPLSFLSPLAVSGGDKIAGYPAMSVAELCEELEQRYELKETKMPAEVGGGVSQVASIRPERSEMYA
jgi:hypothetical protein